MVRAFKEKTSAVMLSLSKHGGRGLSARTLRQAQGDNARWFVFAFVLCLLLSTNVSAQGRDVIRNDTLKKTAGLNSLDKNAMYVIDGVISQNKLNGLDPKDIFSINILKNGTRSDPSFGPVSDVLIVVTKTGATKIYQKELSAFSKKYKRYITSHQNNDSDLIYVLNGVVLSTSDVIKQLYDIPTGSIKSVDVMEKYYKGIFNNNKPIIVITTKR